MTHKVNTEFFGREVPVAFMEMVRQTYVYEGTDPNKILSVYQAAKKKWLLQPWEECFLLDRVATLHFIRNEGPEAIKKLSELVKLAVEDTTHDTDIVTGISRCQLSFIHFLATRERGKLEVLKTLLNGVEQDLPNSQTLFDGNYHLLRGALQAHEGDITGSRASLNHAIAILKRLRVSYLEATCHLLFLQTFSGEEKSGLMDYYNAHYQILAEYPYIHKEAKALQLKAFYSLKDNSVNYLDKVSWKKLIKIGEATLQNLTWLVKEIEKTLANPLA